MGFGFHSHGRGIFLILYSHQNFRPKKRYNPFGSSIAFHDDSVQSHGSFAMLVALKVVPKAWDLASTEYEADWGYSFDHEGWSFSPPNTAITGFRRSHENNLYNLEARFLGKLGDFFTIYFVLMAI